VHQFLRELHQYGLETPTAQHLLSAYNCLVDQELFFGYNTRYSEFRKGDALHQVTTGGTGDDFTDVCVNRPSMGRYRYINNKQHAFSHVTVTEREFTVRIMGVDYQTYGSNELYRITVYNKNMF
jgi:hypothetical protein